MRFIARVPATPGFFFLSPGTVALRVREYPEETKFLIVCEMTRSELLAAEDRIDGGGRPVAFHTLIEDSGLDLDYVHLIDVVFSDEQAYRVSRDPRTKEERKGIDFPNF